MVFKLPRLPYSHSDLEPYISARTLELHHGKHHQGYVNKLNELTEGTPDADANLYELVTRTMDQPDKQKIFNQAAQCWNHAFFWRSMKPAGGGHPYKAIAEYIDDSFGSFDEFKTAFQDIALAQFGSGWVWLVKDESHESTQLRIVSTSNAEVPQSQNLLPILVCDVWEHAYYLDYQNLRTDFVRAFLNHLVNWDFANQVLHDDMTLYDKIG
jgi:Fe-Mn family superoxide dismutase